MVHTFFLALCEPRAVPYSGKYRQILDALEEATQTTDDCKDKYACDNSPFVRKTFKPKPKMKSKKKADGQKAI